MSAPISIFAAPQWLVLISPAHRSLGTYDSAEDTPGQERKGEPGALNLRNTHIGNLMDAKGAWPAKGQLRLDGFSFNHLGGFEGETGLEMRARGMDWWNKNWARLDPDYSPAPNAQLA